MDRVLCFSGGVDSFVAYHYMGKPQTLYFDLQTPYSEKEKKVIQELVPNTIIDSSLSLGERQVEKKAYVPFRNLYVAMLATKYADRIAIVGIKGDNVSDKNPEIFSEFSRLLSTMEDRHIEVFSPFWDMDKSGIVHWYLEHVGDQGSLMKTVSCYDSGDSNYCGRCPACFRKWVAFRANGIDIPFHNKELMQEYYNSAQAGRYDSKRNAEIIREVDGYIS